MQFRRCTWRRLPRVMAMTLALDTRDQAYLCEQIQEAAKGPEEWAAAVRETSPSEEHDAPILARIFAEILNLEQPAREEFASFYDRLLDRQGDLFGTEGQLDPRGDRRD